MKQQHHTGAESVGFRCTPRPLSTLELNFASALVILLNVSMGFAVYAQQWMLLES